MAGVSSSGAEVIAAPVRDGLEAGTLWRKARLDAFRKRVEEVMKREPVETVREALEEELRRVEEESKKLDAMTEEQSRGTKSAPWWADGDYDKRRADQENDEGIRFLQMKKFGCAFDAFTRAIRLFPSVAAYHSNRAVREEKKIPQRFSPPLVNFVVSLMYDAQHTLSSFLQNDAERYIQQDGSHRTCLCCSHTVYSSLSFLHIYVCLSFDSFVVS